MGVSINISDKDLKNTKIQPTTNRKKAFPVLKVVFGILFAVILSIGGYFLYRGYKVSHTIGFQFKPNNIFQTENEPELKKDSTGKYTSVLIIGTDTRENGNLMNTDSIILAIYSYETKDVTMLSIPRDLWVKIYPNKTTFSKINSVYASHEQKTKGSGMEALKNVIQEITDIEIQYHIMIDFKAFVELIDTVGGVTINVENSFTDYMYPKGLKYQTISFKSGPQIMNGETALQFSRSRHSRDNGEGSDFMRAKRQQLVIAALRDSLLNSKTLLNPKKIMDLMSTVQNNIKISEFTIDDIEAAINILEDFKEADANTYSFVLDPTAGGGSLIQSLSKSAEEGGYMIVPTEGPGKYTKIKEYLDLVFKNPRLYSENPTIYVYNAGLGYQATYDETKKLTEKFKYLKIKYLGNLYSDKQGIYIFSNKENEFTYSTNLISKYINSTNTTKPEFITTNLKGEDITVLFGKPIEADILTSQ